MARLIDTSVIISMERRGLDPSAIEQILPADEDVALAAITVSELVQGVERSNSAARRFQKGVFLDALLDAYPVLPFGLSEARAHGHLAVELSARGMKIGANDALIAATALAQGYGVLTENVGEFGRVAGLDVASPTWP